MKWIIIMMLYAANVSAQSATYMSDRSLRFNSSSNAPLEPSVLSSDYHLRHYQVVQAGQKESSSNIYDTIDRYILEKSFELRNPQTYQLKRFIYTAPQNSVDHENQKVNNNGNGNLNNTNSYRP